MKIGDIEIENIATQKVLASILENKEPTNKTILLLRLFLEQNINLSELLILKKDDYFIENDTSFLNNVKKIDEKNMKVNPYSGIRQINYSLEDNIINK
ncbi:MULTISPECIES: hypothetical protein [unclassified Aerococcus]|uniref:hypothetical protein n=1 Tax=unclassified Aerococcus TaxID=2618060 RepID=UPI0008A41B65|nr:MULTISPECIES: hypothetical protein [unclassified Aerococcus]MDK6679220.1 hypothetical protein [Aerococcus sp. UMB8608]MDK6685938.1 hypothetical protein [Aerococcus sp. UMB8623]MDK6939295.1 hypothetical protein [Aerococcus sp. UMB8487]OFK21283.1 hypothetical protein HMPREF2829_03835 [Aerococcus sp. HMSC072A12]OFR32561.1 hypothetical protein HMPREF2892_08080 [Aerococcus sp. HMSC061A03]